MGRFEQIRESIRVNGVPTEGAFDGTPEDLEATIAAERIEVDIAATLGPDPIHAFHYALMTSETTIYASAAEFFAALEAEAADD